MSSIQSVKNQIQTLIDNANATTGNSDTTLTTAQASLIEGYGQGSSSNMFGIRHSENVSFYFYPVLPVLKIESNAINRITSNNISHATHVAIITE